MKNWLLVMLILAPAVWAGDEAKPPIAANPVVEVRGEIVRVQIAAGQGTPMIEVQTAKGLVKLYLGSMRYLIEENFTPKAGELVEATGYKTGDGVVAIQVELPRTKKILKLRDENGRPMWMGGRRRSPSAQNPHP